MQAQFERVPDVQGNTEVPAMPAEEPGTAQSPEDRIGDLSQLIWAFTISQALCAAAKLGIADVVRDGPKTSREIAETISASEPALLRLLRALSSVDLLAEDENGRFTTTLTGEHLRSDHPQSIRAMATCLGSPFIWHPWASLSEAIVTGKPAFEQLYGRRFFDYLASTPKDAAVFDAMTAEISRNQLSDLLAAYDFSGFNKIVDVGGGRGALLRGILESSPDAKGVLFDLPGVVAQAREIRESAAGPRCEIVGGDMFKSVPADGDAYVLKGIVHDWADAEVIQVLRNCRQATIDTGKLLVIEFVSAPSGQHDFAKRVDLMMLVLLTGRERTEADFRDLYAAAGFQLQRIIPAGGQFILEGVPA